MLLKHLKRQQRERQQQQKTLTLSLPSHAEIEFEDGPEPGYARILKPAVKETKAIKMVATPVTIPSPSRIPSVANGGSRGKLPVDHPSLPRDNGGKKASCSNDVK